MTKQIFLLLIGFSVFNSCNQKQNKIDWVFVEGGTFEQGKNQIIISPKGDTISGFTSPNRIVEIDDFYISKYEITVKQFREFCKSTGREMPDPPIENAYGEKVYYKWIDDYPMLATWNEANDFAKWAGGRLAHEYEWEIASQAGILHDTGIVWEWCRNVFFPYSGFTAFPYAGYSTPYYDGNHYTLKGGSVYTRTEIKRPTFRNYYQPDKNFLFAGIRLVFGNGSVDHLDS